MVMSRPVNVNDLYLLPEALRAASALQCKAGLQRLSMMPKGQRGTPKLQ